MLKKIADTVFNMFYYKVALMVLLIPTLLVYCVTYDYKMLSIMMYWGAVACVYDLFWRRNFVKARGMLWLLGFLAVFFLTVYLNFSRGFALNFTSWIYTALALFLLYPDGTTKDRPTVLKELSVLNTVFLGMTAVLSTVSLGMFITLYSERIPYGDQLYAIGWVENRLFGVYSNTGYMISAIGLAIICLQAAVLKAKNGKIKVPYIVFLAYTALVNFCSMCMENAKGAFLSLGAFAAIAVFFLLARGLRRKGWRAAGANTTAIVAAALSVAVLIGGVYAARGVLKYAPAAYEALGGTLHVTEEPLADDASNTAQNTEKDDTTKTPSGDEVETPPEAVEKPAGDAAEKQDTPSADTTEKAPTITGVNIDREKDEGYGLFTGRPVIWKFGWEEFLKKPIFGHGPQSHRDVYIVDNYLRHFHNLIIHTMVSVGTVGSVCIFAFFATVLVFLLKKLFLRLREGTEGYSVTVMLIALLGMLAVNSMSEVTILFIARFAMFIFWIYLGYAVALLTDDEKTRGTRLLETMSDKVNAWFKK